MLSITPGAMGNRSAADTVAVLWGADHHNPDRTTPTARDRGAQKHQNGCIVKTWQDINTGDVLYCFP